MKKNNPVEFINEIKRKGILLSLKGNDLDIKAPKGVMTQEILSDLKQT
jgi:hypothetical protein